MEKIMLRGVLWKPQSTEQTYGIMRLHSVPVMQAKGLGKYNTQLKNKMIWLPLGFPSQISQHKQTQRILKSLKNSLFPKQTKNRKKKAKHKQQRQQSPNKPQALCASLLPWAASVLPGSAHTWGLGTGGRGASCTPPSGGRSPALTWSHLDQERQEDTCEMFILCLSISLRMWPQSVSSLTITSSPWCLWQGL